MDIILCVWKRWKNLHGSVSTALITYTIYSLIYVFYSLSTEAEKNTLQLRLPPCFPSFLQFPCCQAFQLSAPCFAVLSDKKRSCELIMGCPSQYSRIIPTQYNYFFLLPDKPIFDSLHFCFFPLALHLISFYCLCGKSPLKLTSSLRAAGTGVANSWLLYNLATCW